jgi:hypothetical protein
MARGSVTHAPVVSLSKWTDLDPAMGAKLASAGFVSVDDVGEADPAELAAAIGVTADEASKLVTDAKGAGRSALPVGTLAAINKSEEKALNDLVGGSATLGAIAEKTPAEIAAAFGGNVGRATAVLNGIKAGLARGAIR